MIANLFASIIVCGKVDQNVMGSWGNTQKSQSESSMWRHQQVKTYSLLNFEQYAMFFGDKKEF